MNRIVRRRPASARVFALTALLLHCKRGAAGEAEPEAPPTRVRCEPATRVALRDVRPLRGTVAAAPDRDAVISPQVSGRLLRVAVREGDAVARNQIVAEVESQPTRDALVQARAQLAQAEAQAHNATTALDRSQHLFERGIAARQEVDDATARRAETQAAVAAARAAVDLAARNLARAQVRSPIAGVVVHVTRRAGELVDGTPATAVLEVADPAGLEFVAGASPSVLVDLRAGQTGVARFDALSGRDFPVIVRAVSPGIDPASGVGSVRLSLGAAGDAGTTPPFGLFGTAEIAVGTEREAIVVPPAAIRSGNNGTSEVLVCEGETVHVRSVQLGVRERERVEIASGLREHERVAVENVLGLTDGASIEVVEDGGRSGAAPQGPDAGGSSGAAMGGGGG